MEPLLGEPEWEFRETLGRQRKKVNWIAAELEKRPSFRPVGLATPMVKPAWLEETQGIVAIYRRRRVNHQ